jgi:hypothetical protein
MPQPIVYISGPYTLGDVDSNVLTANQLGIKLIEQGHAVYIPHLSHYLNLQLPHDYRFWMEQCLMWVSLSSYLIRIPGESAGADEEVKRAHELGIPVIQLVDLADPFLLPCPECGDNLRNCCHIVGFDELFKNIFAVRQWNHRA